MSSVNPSEISVQYKLTRALSLDFDKVVVSVDISNIQYRQIKKQEVDFTSGNPKVAVLQNYAVNDITLKNGTVKNGKFMDLLIIQMPLSVAGKSRNFYMRFNKPTECKYKFVDCDGVSPIKVQSNVDLTYQFDDHLKHPDSLSTYVFECYELTQNPTTFYIGSQNQLSSVDVGTWPIRPSKIQ